MVGLLRRGSSPSQDHNLHRTTQIEKTQIFVYQCLESDSNQWSQRWSGRRHSYLRPRILNLLISDVNYYWKNWSSNNVCTWLIFKPLPNWELGWKCLIRNLRTVTTFLTETLRVLLIFRWKLQYSLH